MPSIVNNTRLLQEAYDLFGNTRFAVPRDTNVVCPDRPWFERQWVPHFDQITERYVAETYDCEDFCAEAWCHMSRSLRRTPQYHGKGHSLGYVEGSIPAGQELNGVRDGVHATCVIRFSDGQWFFFEPQPSPVRLTRVEEAVNKTFFPREVRL